MHGCSTATAFGVTYSEATLGLVLHRPWELLALKAPAVIIPGADAAHATLAARYLQECLDGSVYHGVPPMDQSPDDVRQWINELEAHTSVPTA